MNTTPFTSSDEITQRASALFQESQDKIYRRTDRLFAYLMGFQWLAGIAAAVWISPLTWIGTTSQVHWHVWAAIFLGGAISSLPIYMVRTHPGEALTRHTIAVAQMLTSALLIHLTGGRIETHFHVFGSLAFLACYRDWRVLVTGTIVVAADHFLRGLYWPESVFGVLAASPWRWVEHAGWVVFEDIFLIISIRQSLQDMREVATDHAKLEAVNTVIEQQVTERTVELAYERDLLRTLMSNAPDCIYFKDLQSKFVYCSAELARVLGHPMDEVIGKTDFDFFTSEDAQKMRETEVEIIHSGEPRINFMERKVLPNGALNWTLGTKMPWRNSKGEIVGTFGISKDITDLKQAEIKVEQVNKQLWHSSRQAGMAEVATSVLHNVGNVLNSVNVSATLVADQVRQSKIVNLTRINGLLQEHKSDLPGYLTTDAQGQQIPGYLVTLAEHLTREQGNMLKELDALRKNMEHIKEIVAMQQNYSKVFGLTETLPLIDIVEDALRLNAGAFARHDVDIVRDYQAQPVVTVEKHKVLQILVNVLRNAKYACDESGRSDKRMKINISADNGRVRVSVADNGVGIARKNLTNIFAHGFTTRKDGHGYGLHSGALTAKELGGALVAQSDGPGQGAVFVLELPNKPEGVPNENNHRS